MSGDLAKEQKGRSQNNNDTMPHGNFRGKEKEKSAATPSTSATTGGLDMGTFVTRKRKRGDESRGTNAIVKGGGAGGAHQHKTIDFRDTGDQQQHNKHGSHFMDGKQRDKSYLKRRAQELRPIRQALPVFAEADRIRDALRSPEQKALLLVGETGSGKSTQVPQILVDESWAQRKSVKVDGKIVKVGGCIAITEPRRVAAVSLARRVAEEMGTPLGSASPASQVGYSVRFDNSTSPGTRVKFLTEGMLLQEMLRDPWLREYSAVLVDEVHERGVNVDLVMGFLKQMIDGDNKGRGGIPLKVVVMSATADMELVEEFLKKEPQSEEQNGHDDAAESEGSWDGFSDRDEHKKEENAVKSISASKISNGTKAPSSRVSTLHIKGRQYPVDIIYTPSPVSDFIEAALNTIFKIHVGEPLPGDILVFLTGQETVENLLALCTEFAATMPPSVPKLLILPLFAALPQTAQQQVFLPTPKGHRKVILSTNLAETSVTVPGVHHVIDSGKHKRKQFRSRLSLDSLLVKPISKSSAKQRAGRAGREPPGGTCYRLYPETEYLKLPADTSPEILRCDLSQAILTLKAHSVDDITTFPLLTRPPAASLQKALLSLLHLSALNPQTGNITPLGRQLARLPLSPRLGRVLLAASTHSVTAEVIDIISALSVESLFLQTHAEDLTEKANEARRDLYRREGDHLTLLATVQSYLSETSDRKSWCEKRFISHRAMKAVLDVRKQLLDHAKRSGMILYSSSSSSSSSSQPPPNPSVDSTSEKTSSILKSFLTSHYPTSLALLTPSGTYETLTGKQPVSIHPSSVLFVGGRALATSGNSSNGNSNRNEDGDDDGGGKNNNRKGIKRPAAIMYNEFVFTNRAYARGVSAVEWSWVEDVMSEMQF